MSDLNIFLREFSAALTSGSASVLVGAGTSMAAGYPSWKTLLTEIAGDLGLKIEDLDDLTAVAQWAIGADHANRTSVINSIRSQINPDFDIPPSVMSIARLPLKDVWTTNYDRLIERAYGSLGRPVDVRSSQKQLSMPAISSGSIKIYKMHGTIDAPEDIVISTEDYELYRRNRASFLNLLHAHLTSMTFLFIGMSLTDPNVKHVLALLRENFPENPPRHFMISRRPQRIDFDSDDAHLARLARHNYWVKDLRRYGLVVVEIEEYSEIDDIMRQLELELARKRVWVSGSWPTNGTDPRLDFVQTISHTLGARLGSSEYFLVSGNGLLVGSSVLAGFLQSMQMQGQWDFDRRLILRSFPKSQSGSAPPIDYWDNLRYELARFAGIVVFIGGLRIDDGITEIADGVLKERDIAEGMGAFILPIGVTGGAAAVISNSLKGSALPFDGKHAKRPGDEDLDFLSNPHNSVDQLIDRVMNIIKTVSR